MLTDSLTQQVTSALAGDRRTAPFPIEVIAIGGTVTLAGQVPTVEAKAAAEQIARSVSGVTTVLNELKVAPAR